MFILPPINISSLRDPRRVIPSRTRREMLPRFFLLFSHLGGAAFPPEPFISLRVVRGGVVSGAA